MAKRGADAVIDTLSDAGVKHLFTLSGNHVMPVFDATIGSGIDLLHTRHEAATVHMADAWARLTGEVGIALVTGGPGHANAVSALYTALMAESPVVLISGHAPLAQLGQGAFHRCGRRWNHQASFRCAQSPRMTALGLAHRRQPQMRLILQLEQQTPGGEGLQQPGGRTPTPTLAQLFADPMAAPARMLIDQDLQFYQVSRRQPASLHTKRIYCAHFGENAESKSVSSAKNARFEIAFLGW